MDMNLQKIDKGRPIQNIGLFLYKNLIFQYLIIHIFYLKFFLFQIVTQLHLSIIPQYS